MEAHTDTTTQAGQILASASGGKRRPGDRIFSNAADLAGVTVLAILAGVAIFLVIKSVPAIGASTSELPDGKTLIDYVAPLAFGTILAASVAVVIAVPLAVAVALFISHIAPRRIANTLAYIVDLLAAIPSIVYGLWGIFVLGPAIVPVLDWLVAQPGLHPHSSRAPHPSRAAPCSPPALVLAVMILPIVSAVSREVFSQTPRRLEEGALALGATRWEMIRMAVFALRQVGRDQRLDAGAGPRPGGDDGRHDHPLGVRDRHLQPGEPGEPDADRGEHRVSASRSPPGSRSTP